MYFTGNSYRSLVESPIMKLDLDSIILYGTGGTVEVGVSGNSNKLRFLFSGQKIYSPTGKLIGSFNSGESFDIDWLINSSVYQYSVNGEVLENRKTKPSFNIQRFFVNSTGLPISLHGQLYSENISYDLNFPSQFQALNIFSGGILNHSNYNFKVFDTSLEFYNGPEEVLTGNSLGTVTGATTFPLVFQDTNDSLLDSEISFGITIDTSIGQINETFTVNRVSGLETTTGALETDTENEFLISLFDGSGITGNKFTYINTPSSLLINYYSPFTNLKGEEKPKTINISITGINPLNNSTYHSSYVTGFLLTNSGEYLIPPIAKFTGYYYVSGLDTALNSILLSSGCSGAVPVTFSGNNSKGLNASGVLNVSKVVLSGIYGEGRTTYYLPQTFSLLSGGTGYLSQPRAFLQTGVLSNCYDVGGKYNTTYLIFKPFTGNGLLGSSADYLTGEVLTTTGLVSGGQLTGYLVTGVRFTNIGSGYNTGNYIPKVSFLRGPSDTLTGFNINASGNLQMKSTGFYRFTENWGLNTGLSSTQLTGMNGVSGSTIMDSGANYFTVQVNLTGADWTEPVVAQIITSMGSISITHLISGIRSYDTSTGFLKKKNNLSLIIFTPNQDLSFDLTESELDEYYSSSDYLDAGQTIDLGDLDFGD
jgi:hypothetical protein